MAENTVRERLDTSETANSNRSPGISEGTFLQKFGKEYIEQGKLSESEKNELIEEIMTKDSLAETQAKKALEKFRASDDIYGHINLEKIDIFMLQKQVAKSYLTLQKSRQRFESFVVKEYDVDSKTFQKKIAPELKKKGEKEIAVMLKYESKLHEFLKNTLGNIPARREKITVLAGFSESLIQKRIAKMSDTEKKEVLPVLSKIQNANIPNDFDIRTLVTSSLFDAQQKIDFVHTYIPFINLAQAVEIGLILENDADRKRKAFVDQILDDVQISEDNKKHVRIQITNQDIELPTRDLVTDATHAMKVSEEVGFEAFEKDASAAYESELNRIKANGPQSFEDLKKMLSEINRDARFENISLLSENKIVKISKRTSTGDEISYIQITGIDDGEKKFSFRVIGNEAINLENPGEIKDVEYAVFYENLRNSRQTQLSVFSEETIKTKMQSGEIASNELQLKQDTSSFEGEAGATLRQEMKALKISSIEKEIADLNAKITSEEYVSQKSQNEIEKAKLEREKNLLQDTEFSPADALIEYNKQEFLKKLNEIDPSGSSLGFGPGVAFTVGEGEKQRVYTIKSVDFEDWKIHFYSRAEHESDINLSSFFSQYKKEKAKRVASIGTEEKLVKHFGDNFEFKNGEIVQKDAELNGEKITGSRAVVQYLTNGKGKLIKLVSLGNGMVEFQEGEIEDGEDKKDHAHHAEDRQKEQGRRKKIQKEDNAHHHSSHGPKEKKYKLFITGAQKKRWTLDEFYQYINSDNKKEKFTADWKTGEEKIEERPLEEQNITHGSFLARFFQGMSLYEIMHGGHMVFEGIKESLEHGSHGKSAHAALMLSKFLPGELREDMLIKVEAAEAEDMEAQYTKLGKIDSKPAAKRIRKWLANRDTPQYKLEAAMLYMMSKYGHLSAKGPLADLRGSYVWYERLGGRINDELFLKVKNEADGQTFTEERLVYALLSKQCKEDHGYNGIHRRTRIYKEYENNWKKGVKEEYDKGYSDASNYRTAKAMVKGGLGELEGGTTTNAFGWAKKACEKGGSLEDMTAIPFVAMYSGAIFQVDQTSYTDVKALWDKGYPITAFYMMKDVKSMKVYNNTVLALSKKIEQTNPQKYGGMYKKAKEIWDSVQSGSGDETKRINDTIVFWEKYGEVLARALSMSLGDENFSKTDTIIRQERNTPPFNEYFSTIHDEAAAQPEAFGKDFMDDAFGENGVTGISPYQLTKKYLKLGPDRTFYDKSVAPKIWKLVSDDIKATPKKVFIGNNIESTINKQAQKEHIVYILQEVVAGFYELGTPEYIFNAFNSAGSNLGQDMNNWGLNLRDDLGPVSSRDVLAGKYKKVFLRVAENIISGRGGENTTVQFDIPDILKKTKVGAYQATAANNNLFQDAA